MTATLIPIAPAPAPQAAAGSKPGADSASDPSSPDSFAGELARAGGQRKDTDRSTHNHDTDHGDSAHRDATDPMATATSAAVALVATVPTTGGTVATGTTGSADAVGAIGGAATATPPDHAGGPGSAGGHGLSAAAADPAGAGAPADISAVIDSAAGSPGQPQAADDHGKGPGVSATATAGAAGSGVGAGAGVGGGSTDAALIDSAAGSPGQPQAADDHGKGAAVSALATTGAQGLGERAARAGAAGATPVGNNTAGTPGQPQPADDHGNGAAVSALATAGAQGQARTGIDQGKSTRDGNAPVSATDGTGSSTTAGAAFSLPSGPNAMTTTTNPATTNAAASATTTVPVPDPQPALTSALARLHVNGDGTQQLSVQLHPAELGAVSVTATISNGTLNVTVACADQAARAAVTAALPSLHHQLSAAGFTGVDVNFGGPSQQAPQQHADPRGTGGGYSADGARDTGPSGVGSATASSARASARLHAHDAGNAGLDRLL
jgi:hypothetical protein